MAARPLTRLSDDGRPVALYGDRWIYTDEVAAPPKATPEEIVAHPTERHPRYRLRVFDLCWPWRATIREVLRDARMSRNGRYDEVDRLTYLDAAANIQQDPPDYMDLIRLRMARGEL